MKSAAGLEPRLCYNQIQIELEFGALTAYLLHKNGKITPTLCKEVNEDISVLHSPYRKERGFTPMCLAVQLSSIMKAGLDRKKEKL